MVLYGVRFVEPALRLEIPFDQCPCHRRRMLRTRSFEDPFVRRLVPCKKQSLQSKRQTAVRKDDRNFCIPVEVEGYKPEEITVNVTDDRKVVIQAKHEEQSEEGSFSSRQFLREFAIPADIDPGTVRAEMDKDGVLNLRGNSKVPKETREKRIDPGTVRAEMDKDGVLNLRGNSKVLKETREKRIDPGTVRAELDQDGVLNLRGNSKVPKEKLRSNNGCLVPVRGFKPEEIAVKVKDGKVLVHAKHEEKKPGALVYHEVRREFPIPPEVHPDSIVAEINGDGLLTIMERKAEEVTERVIPVEQPKAKGDDKVESGENMATTDDQQTLPKAE